ncbi:helix-turn-helix transcriptional regulator [Methylomarinum vadi]|uniref:helix-turn-helix transcriptional regulator n=1 Tax=Methylomarinum vadi TaxID=438855 RepID=UPI0004DF519B|nr:WYL domain-containing protein [Methylomarinum vadi]
MSKQKSQATQQRRSLVLESIRRLSGKSLRWVTGSEIVRDLTAQGYDVAAHHIRRDLKALLPLHPQLEVNDNSKGDEGPVNGLPFGYRWVGTDVEPSTGLTLPEALSLVMVERYLGQSLPVLLTQSLNDLFEKAQQTLDLHKKSQVTHWPDKISVIQPAQTLLPPDIDSAISATVHEALIKEKQLEVTYQSIHRESAKEKTYRLHPLGLIQRGPVTYLVAMANDYEDAYIYALHRILSANSLEDGSRQKSGFNLNHYAQKRGHFGSGESILFKARIVNNLSDTLQETPLHASQSITEDDNPGYKILQAELPNTWQLRWWILGEGDRIEVLGPKTLRDDIAETLRNAVKQY